MKTSYNDSRFIHAENFLQFCNTNEAFLTLPVKGIVVELPGLGGGSCLGGSMELGSYDSEYAKDFGKNGILLAYMFPGPWSWGNKGAVRYADAVVRAIAAKYHLAEGFPLAVCGGSMGGLGALMYAAESTLPLCAAAAACPCVDVIDRLASHPEFPRTFVSAAMVYDLDLEEALKAISPVKRIADLPDIPYFISNDGEDEVFPEAQCDAYVEKLRARGLYVEYLAQPGLKHGEFFPEVRERLHTFLKEALLGVSVSAV